MSVRRSERSRKPKVEIYTPDELTPAFVRRPKLRPRKETNYKVDNDSFSGTFNTDDNSSESDTDNSSDSELFSKKAKRRKLSENSRNDNSMFQSLEAIDLTEEENEYRLQRQKNMQDRFKILDQLNFNDDIKEIKSIVPLRKVEKPKSKNQNKAVKRISSEPLIRRSSLRLQNRLTNSSFVEIELPFGFRDEPTKKDKFQEIIIDENVPFIRNNDDNLTEILKSLQEDIDLPFEETCDFSLGDFDKYCEVVKSCRMRHEPYKIIKDRIVSMDFHPSAKKLLILAGDKYGFITIQDIVKPDIGLQFKPHAFNVNCVSFSVHDHTKFYSTSLEGATRQGDINSSQSTLVYKADSGEHTTWHHEFDDSLFVAEGDGVVKLVDLRAPGDKFTSIKCHPRSVRTVQLHPTNDNYFITSSGCGEFGIFDIRTSNSKYPNPVIVQEFDKALTSAFISAQGNYVVSTCNDDTIRVFDVSNLKTSTQISKIEHNNHCGRWLSQFKAKWQPGREDAYFVGSMLQPKRLQLYHRDGTTIHQFLSDAMTTYSPVIVAHSTQPIYVGGTGSGKIHVFSPFASLEEMYS